MLENKGYVHPEVLVDADWVEAHLRDPQVRLIEVDVDTSAYEQGHIPGAVGFNWQKELQDQVIRAPLSKEHLEELLGRAGVSNDTTVVFYGDNNNWFAAFEGFRWIDEISPDDVPSGMVVVGLDGPRPLAALAFEGFVR